jgi:hypothetical protein
MSMKLFCDWCDKEIDQHLREMVDLTVKSTYRKDWMEHIVLCKSCGDILIAAINKMALERGGENDTNSAVEIK